MSTCPQGHQVGPDGRCEACDYLKGGLKVAARTEFKFGDNGNQGHAGSDEAIPGTLDDLPVVEAHLTDYGNAIRLVRRHGEDLHYCSRWGKWLTWTGKRWADDDTGRVYRMAKQTAISIYDEVTNASNLDERKAIFSHAARSESRSRLEAMVGLAESEPGIPVVPDDLDTKSWLLNLRNGILDLHTGKPHPHRREDLLTKQSRVKFDPKAEAPMFMAFLDKIMDGNQNLVTYLQRTLGRALTGDVTEHRLEIWHGVGANGKSTLMGVIMDVLGDYAKIAAPGLLLDRRHEGHPTERADLKGARFVGSIEVGETRSLAEELVKQLTGGDKIKARFMRQDYWEFEPTHKLVIACNHRPIIKGSDHAIWRRVRLVPFNIIIPDDEQDKDLRARLWDESSGILNWLLQGCLDWQRDGLTDPDEVKAATAEYRAEQDTIVGFIEDRCVVGPNRKVAAGDLYTAYGVWCKDTKEEQLSKRAFGLRLAEQGFIPDRTKAKRWWFGIGLVTQPPLSESDTGVT
jgi:putative DNA primase/helicase